MASSLVMQQAALFLVTVSSYVGVEFLLMFQKKNKKKKQNLINCLTAPPEKLQVAEVELMNKVLKTLKKMFLNRLIMINCDDNDWSR